MPESKVQQALKRITNDDVVLDPPFKSLKLEVMKAEAIREIDVSDACTALMEAAPPYP